MGLNVIDNPGYQRYRKAILAILNACGGSFGYDFRVPQGLLSKPEENINRGFSIEFPSKQTMQKFFEDADYVVIQNRHLNHAIKSKTIISMHEHTEMDGYRISNTPSNTGNIS